MKKSDVNSLQLTVKQRLAVSRQALVAASEQSIWGGLSAWAAKEMWGLVERRVKCSNKSSSKGSSNGQ
jgi:hypothetical protein